MVTSVTNPCGDDESDTDHLLCNADDQTWEVVIGGTLHLGISI